MVVPVAASGNETTIIKTDFLIIGAGPAGGTLGCFLGSHGKARNPLECWHPANQLLGLKGVIISASPSTANTPRAHIINAAAFGKWVKIHLEVVALLRCVGTRY